MISRLLDRFQYRKGGSLSRLDKWTTARFGALRAGASRMANRYESWLGRVWCLSHCGGRSRTTVGVRP
jgi:hypothetical protein